MKKFKSQLRLLEGIHEESSENNHEEGERGSLYIPTSERRYYGKRLLYDEQNGWIEEFKEDIFYDCEPDNIVENSSSRSSDGINGIINEKQSFESTSSYEADEERTTRRLEENELGLLNHNNFIMKIGLERKRTDFLIRIYLLGVIILVIGLYVGQKLNMLPIRGRP
ncbi:uncharacterized protein LOC109849596 isoform X2 [Asparagus officinalis]|nr:uncharacterized protein LOC109849596 isoform X2 [Asparagus officinalis]